jgi:hypothetical protein
MTSSSETMNHNYDKTILHRKLFIYYRYSGYFTMVKATQEFFWHPSSGIV